MKLISVRLLVLLVGTVLPLLAAASNKFATATYRDPDGALHFSMPEGWKVHTGEANGQPQWKVRPRKADERERAAIRISIVLRPMARKESLERISRQLKAPKGGREPAINLQHHTRLGRLTAEYREGQFVTGGLWLVRHYVVTYQKIGKLMIEASCSSTDAEYRHYRQQLNLVCGSVKAGR
jgi:hypothetical protein